jgi:hypothetical protein
VIPYLKKSITKRSGGVAQGVGPEFKSQFHKEEEGTLDHVRGFLKW